MAVKKKPKGPLKRGELDLIKANVGVLTSAEMAERLGRPEETVVRQLARFQAAQEGRARPAAPAPNHPPSRAQALGRLHDSPSWSVIKNNFTPTECRFYEEQYCLLLEQFGEDVLATEFLQVDRLITHLIMSHRALARVKETQRDIDLAEKKLAQAELLYPEPEAREPRVEQRLQQQRDHIANLNGRMTAATREFRELDDSQQKLTEKLKGTREQRVKDLTAKRDRTFADLLLELRDAKGRERLDREAALVRAAAERKREELARPRKFADDLVDRPLLCPELLPVNADPADGGLNEGKGDSPPAADA